MSLYSKHGAPCSSLSTETQTYWGKDVSFRTHILSLRYTVYVHLFLQSVTQYLCCRTVILFRFNLQTLWCPRRTSRSELSYPQICSTFQRLAYVMKIGFSFFSEALALPKVEPLLNISSGLIVFGHSTCKNTLCSGWMINKQRRCFLSGKFSCLLRVTQTICTSSPTAAVLNLQDLYFFCCAHTTGLMIH